MAIGPTKRASGTMQFGVGHALSALRYARAPCQPHTDSQRGDHPPDAAGLGRCCDGRQVDASVMIDACRRHGRALRHECATMLQVQQVREEARDRYDLAGTILGTRTTNCGALPGRDTLQHHGARSAPIRLQKPSAPGPPRLIGDHATRSTGMR